MIAIQQNNIKEAVGIYEEALDHCPGQPDLLAGHQVAMGMLAFGNGPEVCRLRSHQ